MINEELKSTFNESVEIRERIQNELRQDYKDLKSLVETACDKSIDGSTFKLIVDMYHYKDGGYPNLTSKPKHVDVLQKFSDIVRILNFIEMDEFLYIDTYGIKVEITNPIEDFQIVGDMLDTIKSHGYTGTTFKEFLAESVLRGSNIQTTICQCSDEIKDKSKEVEETANIKKKHYMSSVMTEFRRRDAANDNNVKRLEKIEETIDAEYESYVAAMALLSTDEKETVSTLVGDITKEA